MQAPPALKLNGASYFIVNGNNSSHMSSDDQDYRNEILRIRRLCDMLVSAHAHLRERFSRKALILDLSILVLAIWLTSVVFVEPRLNVKLTPFGLDPQIWIGILSILALFLSILQLRVDWKGQSDAHKRAFDVYLGVKFACRKILSDCGPLNADDCHRVMTQYELACSTSCLIPEKCFLAEKKRHIQKVRLSKLIDERPAASLWLLRLRHWWGDNLGPRKNERSDR